MSCKKFIAAVMLFLCIGVFTNVVYAAKSVFVVNSHGGYEVQAYRIDSNHVTLQGTVALPANGPLIDLAVFPQKELLFATNEESAAITYVSTKTLAEVGHLDPTAPSEFAGIVVDTGKGKIYAAQRGSPYLYVYSWSDSAQMLIADGNNPHNLDPNNEGIGLYDLALDENSGRLYLR